MSSPSFDPSSMEQKEQQQQQQQQRARPTSSNPFWDMSSEQFMMMSSPPGTFSSQLDNPMDERDENETRPREEEGNSAPTEKVLDPTIDCMATKDSGPISASSPAKSETSYDDTISSSPYVFNPQASASTEEDESSEADNELYVWDGHMDDEDFWDIDRRRLSLDQCDELASQVSTQISSLLSRFREDNNSLHTRSTSP
jgi:hypothetical protein